METRYLISGSCLFSSKLGKITINWLIWTKKFAFEAHDSRNVRPCPSCSACHRSFNFEPFTIPVLNLMNLIPSVRKFFHPMSHSASLWMGVLLIQSFLFRKQAHHFFCGKSSPYKRILQELSASWLASPPPENDLGNNFFKIHWVNLEENP